MSQFKTQLEKTLFSQGLFKPLVTTMANSSVHSFADLASRPTAVDFGIGVCQINGILYASDGTTWHLISSVIQAPKSANFDLSNNDNGTVIPCSTALTATIKTTANLTNDFLVELQSTSASAVSVTADVGVTFISNGTGVTTVTINNDGSSIVIKSSGTANKFYIYKVGS